MRFVWLLTVIVLLVLIQNTALAASSKKKSSGNKKSSSSKSAPKSSSGKKSSDKEVSGSKTPSKSSKSSKSNSSKSKSSSKSSTSKKSKKKAAASEDDDEDEDKKTLAKPKRSSSTSTVVVSELKKEQMKQRTSTERKRISSAPSDVLFKQLMASRHGSHGKPYDPIADLLWRTGHDHGVPNTPSLYLQFFEMKYVLPFVLSLNRHLWLDTSPLHMHSSVSQSDGKVTSAPSQYALAPAYSICDMLPSLDSKVSCVKSHHFLPHCPAKNSFTSQLPLLRSKTAPTINTSALAAPATNHSVGFCFHSPIMTNRSQLARQRYELFRRPEVRLDFRPTYRTLYERFVAAYNVAYPPIVRTDVSPSSANSNSSALSNEGVSMNANTTMAALISPSMAQRMQRLSQALYSSDRPRDHRFVVVHWHCPPATGLDINRPRRQLRDNGRDRDNDRGRDSVNGNGNGRKKKSKDEADGNTAQKKTSSKHASGTVGGGAHSFSYCGKEFDSMLKNIDRERRLWDRVVATSDQPQTVFDVLIVVTPPHDESYLPLPLDPSSSAQKQQRLTLNQNTFLQSPFFNMLRRRLNASSTSPSASSSSLGSVRLARDVLVDLWPKIAVTIAAAPPSATTNGTAAARAVMSPKVAEIHALEAQLMVDARVFYGLGSGVSLVQDAVESERALRYTNHTGCLLAQNMIADRSSWCFAASPRAMSRNLPLQFL